MQVNTFYILLVELKEENQKSPYNKYIHYNDYTPYNKYIAIKKNLV